MARETKPRKADKKARVVLFEDFAGAMVVIERLNDDEVRVHKVKKRRRLTLAELLAGVTHENLHAEVRTGHAVGKEVR